MTKIGAAEINKLRDTLFEDWLVEVGKEIGELEERDVALMQFAFRAGVLGLLTYMAENNISVIGVQGRIS